LHIIRSPDVVVKKQQFEIFGEAMNGASRYQERC
jgi:hypothetical protein